jgi:hypothetical protein
MMEDMRRWTKALMWVGILLACAGAGASIASLFPPNPFPPGVRDPGGQRSVTPTPPPPATIDWSITMVSRTTHTFRVGGSCTSDWRLEGRLRLTPSGRIRGRGVAHLQPGAGCDFPSAQVQTRRVTIGFLGRRDGGDLDLRFREEGRMPVGSQDLGGFLRTLETLRFSIPERAGAEATEPKRIEDPEDEIYASVTTIRLRA